MNENITVSIIIPIYNAASYINKCLDSLLAQTIINYEIICVNDASTDDTLNVLEKYAVNYSCIKIINHQKNKRQGGARNSGIKEAKGLYIGFVDSDDWVQENMYNDLYDEAIKYDLDVVDSDYSMVDSKGEVCEYHLFDNNIHNTIDENTRKKLMVMGGSVWAKVYKRSFLEKNNFLFPENLFYEDNYFVPLVYASMNSYSYLRTCYYQYFINVNSTTKKKNTLNLYDRFEIASLIKERFKITFLYEKYKEECEFLFTLNAFSGTAFASMTSNTSINTDILKKCKQLIKKEVPEYQNNLWYQRKYSLVERMLLSLLEFNIYIYIVSFNLVFIIKGVLNRIKKLLR